MAKISLNEALGRRESKLLSDAVNSNIEISAIEFGSIKDKEGKDVPQAYITTASGEVYRSSNAAILNKLKLMETNLPKGASCLVSVVWAKSKKGGMRYLDFADALPASPKSKVS